MQKLLIIGLDGATWDILLPLINKGKLPTLDKFIKNGTYGELQSTIPPVTGGAWLSLATGKTPGKTGVIDFLNRKNNNTHKLYPVNSKNYQGHSFWDYLSKVGIKVGVFNYPMLYPPYKVNGFMVSGLGASPYGKITYPETLKRKLMEIADKYEISIDYHNKKYNNLDLFLQDLNSFLNKFEKIIEHILSQHWEVLFLVFSVTDWVQHIMWRHIDKTHPMYDPKISPRYEVKFIDFWQRIDKIIESILGVISENANIFLVSDHGFGPNDQTFNLLKWLEMKNYLIRKKFRKKIIKKFIYDIIKKVLPSRVKEYIPVDIQVKVSDTLKDSISDLIDFKKTRAYCLGHTIPFGAIYINTNVYKEKEEIKLDLINSLLNLSKDIGRKVNVQIYDPREIYSGDKINLLPDIIFTINNWRCVIIEDSFDKPLFEEKSFSARHTGSHRLNGIFLAYGPGIKKGCKIYGAKIYDIAPTILHVFGLPIPNDMDGRVLTEIFEPDSEFAKREPKYVDPTYYDRICEKQKIRTKLNKMKTTKKL